MDDKRYIHNDNEDNPQADFNDDYLTLLSEYGDDDEDEFEDVFSDSSNDIYISRSKKRQPESSEDIYISRRRNNQSNDFYSHSDGAKSPQPQRQTSSDEQPQRRRPETHSDESRVRQSRSTQLPPRQKNDKSDTKKIPKIPQLDNDDEISDYEARYGKKSSGRKKKGHSKFFAFVALLLAVVIGLSGMLFVMANGIVSKFTKAEEIEHVEDVDSLVSESHVKNILLIGADKEKGGASRSDSIMIASVNKKTGRITVVSILRDTHLDVPDHRESKINAAYAWGGANLLVQTVEQNFGIKIDDYATVNFEMFTALIDGLGGIEVDVTEDEADYINNRHRYGKEEKPEPVESGENVHLTGYQALWYARIRKLDSDFNRTERQRKVISAIVKDVKGKLNPVEIFGLISTAKEVAPYIETTLSTADFWSLIFSLMSCVTKSGTDMDKLLATGQLPFEDTWWYSSEWDGSSISLDLEENREKLYELLYEEPVVEKNEDSSETSDTE